MLARYGAKKKIKTYSKTPAKNKRNNGRLTCFDSVAIRTPLTINIRAKTEDRNTSAFAIAAAKSSATLKSAKSTQKFRPACGLFFSEFMFCRTSKLCRACSRRDRCASSGRDGYWRWQWRLVSRSFKNICGLTNAYPTSDKIFRRLHLHFFFSGFD